MLGILRVSLAAATVFLVAGTSSVAQETEPLWHVTYEEVELAYLLDAYSNATGLPLDYDLAAVEGIVSIRSGVGLQGDEFWSLLNRLLGERNLACIQAAGEVGLGIVPLDQAAKLARIEPGSAEDAQAGFIKILFAVRETKASGVADVLRNVLTADGSLLEAIPDANQVLIAGGKHQVLEALEVLRRIDVVGVSVVVREINLEYVSPTAVAKLLERISQATAKVQESPLRGMILADALAGTVLIVAPEDELLYWIDNVQRFDRPQPAVTQEYTPVRFGLDETAKLMEEVVRDAGWRESAESWRLVRDHLTGTLVLKATPHQHEEVARLIERLESTPTDALRTVRSFPVRHRDVNQVLELLTDLIGDGSSTRISSMTDREVTLEPVSNATGGTGGPVRTTEGNVTLTKDEGTNRILAVGPPRLVEELGRLIDSLDTKQPQVLVEAMIVSLTQAESQQLAIELQKAGSWNQALLRATSLFGASAPSVAAMALPPASGTGLEAVILDPGSFSGVVRALETLNEGRALNIPKVLVNNHETATLDAVLQTPYVSTNATNTVATTSLGGFSDAGTTISVTPQITDGDQLIVDYEISLSSFVGAAADSTLPPPRQENRLASVVTVPDGFAVVVGGLEIDEETESESKIPLLGDIPLLGALFRSTSVTTTKSRFFVFLRCSVLRNTRFEDLRFLSEDDLMAAGIPSDAPLVEPRIIR